MSRTKKKGTRINSRAKGARGERELAAYLRERGYKDARRGQQYCGANGDADVVGIDGFHIECKRVQALHLYPSMEQAISDARRGEVPVVVHRKDGKKWVAIMMLDDLLDLIGGEDEDEQEEGQEVSKESKV